MISTDYNLFLIFLYNLHGFLIGCSFYIGKASKHWNWARVHMWKPRAISCDQSNVGFYVHNTSPCEIIFKTLTTRNHLFLFVLLQSKVFFFLILFVFFFFSHIFLWISSLLENPDGSHEVIFSLSQLLVVGQFEFELFRCG